MEEAANPRVVKIGIALEHSKNNNTDKKVSRCWRGICRVGVGKGDGDEIEVEPLPAETIYWPL